MQTLKTCYLESKFIAFNRPSISLLWREAKEKHTIYSERTPRWVGVEIAMSNTPGAVVCHIHHEETEPGNIGYVHERIAAVLTVPSQVHHLRWNNVFENNQTFFLQDKVNTRVTHIPGICLKVCLSFGPSLQQWSSVFIICLSFSFCVTLTTFWTRIVSK